MISLIKDKRNIYRSIFFFKKKNWEQCFKKPFWGESQGEAYQKRSKL